MTNIYDALEACLQEIENGADLETVLLRYPDLSEELRPILHSAAEARGLSGSDPSQDVVRRNRATILQRAAEMREGQSRTARPFFWLAPMPRLALAIVTLMLAFVSGTSLVGAASTSLPGDELYPVKRSWERLQVLVLLDPETREALEVDHESERIEELLELFAGKRSEEVMFNGLVTRQDGIEWVVAGIRVRIVPGAQLPGQPVTVGAAVRVLGLTQGDGTVVAKSIEMLSSEDSLPDVEDESREGHDGPDVEASATGSAEVTPLPQAGVTPDADEVTFNGVLDVRNGDFWTINGLPSDVSNAEVIGTPAVGAAVTVEGYFNPDGVFVVTKIRFDDSDSGSGSNSNSNSNDDDNSNDNGNDNSNDNDNDNEGIDNDSETDDDNSGSGGGGDD